MSKNLKKMISYYKPYLGVFWADMFFATVSAAVALVIPLVIRYVTSTLIYMEDKRKEIKNDLINKVDRMQLVDLILVQNAVDILIARDKMETSKR